MSLSLDGVLNPVSDGRLVVLRVFLVVVLVVVVDRSDVMVFDLLTSPPALRSVSVDEPLDPTLPAPAGGLRSISVAVSLVPFTPVALSVALAAPLVSGVPVLLGEAVEPALVD